MYWRKEGNPVNIKNLSNGDIKSNIYYLSNSHLTEVNGYTKPYWLMSFKKELNRRKEIGNAVIRQIPWLNEECNNVIYNIKYKN